MNDITYVGRHDLVSNVSRHRHETWEYVLFVALVVLCVVAIVLTAQGKVAWF